MRRLADGDRAGKAPLKAHSANGRRSNTRTLIEKFNGALVLAYWMFGCCLRELRRKKCELETAARTF